MTTNFLLIGNPKYNKCAFSKMCPCLHCQDFYKRKLLKLTDENIMFSQKYMELMLNSRYTLPEFVSVKPGKPTPPDVSAKLTKLWEITCII